MDDGRRSKFSILRDHVAAPPPPPPPPLQQRDAKIDNLIRAWSLNEEGGVLASVMGDHRAQQRRHIPAPTSKLIFSDAVGRGGFGTGATAAAVVPSSRPQTADGGAYMSNTSRRVVSHLNSLRFADREAFRARLFGASASHGIVDRSTFAGALADVGCVLSKHEREELWTHMTDMSGASAPGSQGMTPERLLVWLGLDIIEAPEEAASALHQQQVQQLLPPRPRADEAPPLQTEYQSASSASLLAAHVAAEAAPPLPPSPYKDPPQRVNHTSVPIVRVWQESRDEPDRTGKRTFHTGRAKQLSSFVGFGDADTAKGADVDVGAGAGAAAAAGHHHVDSLAAHTRRHTHLQQPGHPGSRDTVHGLLAFGGGAVAAGGVQPPPPPPQTTTAVGLGLNTQRAHPQYDPAHAHAQTPSNAAQVFDSAAVAPAGPSHRKIAGIVRAAANLSPTAHDPRAHMSTDDHDRYGGITAADRKALVASLQPCRVHVAVAFRKFLAAARPGSAAPAPASAVDADNTIKCVDLAEAMRQLVPTLPLGVGERTLRPFWTLACDMAGLPHTTSPDDARVSYAAVTRFLDQAIHDPDGLGGDSVSSAQVREAAARAARLQASLRQKLAASRSVQGDRLRLIALVPNLRVRLRNQLSKGRLGHSWDGALDYCTVPELVRLLMQIDLELSKDEAEFVANESANTGGAEADAAAAAAAVAHGVVLERGVKLAQVILYLSDLLVEQ